MRDARSDANQAEIMDALRAVGAEVESLHRVGRGCPDLLVGIFGKNYLMEIKSPRGRLLVTQRIWHRRWPGQVCVVRSVEDALRVIGVEYV